MNGIERSAFGVDTCGIYGPGGIPCGNLRGLGIPNGGSKSDFTLASKFVDLNQNHIGRGRRHIDPCDVEFSEKCLCSHRNIIA